MHILSPRYLHIIIANKVVKMSRRKNILRQNEESTKARERPRKNYFRVNKHCYTKTIQGHRPMTPQENSGAHP